MARARKGAACPDCARRKRKCIHVETTKQIVKIARGEIALPYSPTCVDSKLCDAFVDAIKNLHIDHLWLAKVPCRVGESKVIDQAVRAVVKNQTLALYESDVAVVGGLIDYVAAVEALRTVMQDGSSMVSDEVLITVSLLCVCESLMRSQMYKCFVHWTAMKDILLARPVDHPTTDISLAIFQHIRNQSFHTPCAQGVPSSFDQPRFHDLDPPWPRLSSSFTILQQAYHQHIIRLPTLISLVRALRTNPLTTVPNPDILTQALSLARQLSITTAPHAEDALLHTLHVHRTTHSTDSQLVPYSFTYPDLGALETALTYWSVRLLLGKLRRQLSAIVHAWHRDEEQAEMEVDADWGDVTAREEELERIGMNVAMSIEFARGKRQRAHARGMVGGPALIALWGVWGEETEMWKGVEVVRWRRWIAELQNEALKEWGVRVGEKEVEETSELLAGGELKGFYVRAYSPRG